MNYNYDDYKYSETEDYILRHYGKDDFNDLDEDIFGDLFCNGLMLLNRSAAVRYLENDSNYRECAVYIENLRVKLNLNIKVDYSNVLLVVNLYWQAIALNVIGHYRFWVGADEILRDNYYFASQFLRGYKHITEEIELLTTGRPVNL